MDKLLATKIVDGLESLLLENAALTNLLMTVKKWTKEYVDTLLREAKDIPGVQENVRRRLKPLRDHLESDSQLEEVLREFLKVPTRAW